ncbi:MAG: hypothetical protein WDN44_10490 [Sphingomonas sp.]
MEILAVNLFLLFFVPVRAFIDLSRLGASIPAASAGFGNDGLGARRAGRRKPDCRDRERACIW